MVAWSSAISRLHSSETNFRPSFIYPKNIYYSCLCQKLLPKKTQNWKHLEKNIVLAKSTRKSPNTRHNRYFKGGRKHKTTIYLSLHWPIHNEKTATSQHTEWIFCSFGVYFFGFHLFVNFGMWGASWSGKRDGVGLLVPTLPPCGLVPTAKDTFSHLTCSVR